MEVLPISPFLAPLSEVEQAQAQSADFRSFLALAEKSCGEPPSRVDLSKANFRIADARNGQKDGLRVTDTVLAQGQPVPIATLLEASLQIDRVRLIHSLWKLDSFEEVKSWLTAMRALVRLVFDLDGQLKGHLLLSETIIPMVETVERKDYVLPNGDMASDAITRNFGIRAKVFALDRARRQPRASSGNSHSIKELLARTLSKGNR